MEYTEETYPFLINEILKYIHNIKALGSNDSLIEIIADYCNREGVDEDLVGDAISSDTYFKSFIEKDCINNKIFLTDVNRIDEW